MADNNTPAWDKQVGRWEDSIASDNIKVLIEHKLAGMPWRKSAKKMEDASYGKSYSRAEIEQLLLFRQAPTPIPFTVAIMETAEAMMLSSKANAYAAPIIFPHDDARTQISRKVAGKFTSLLNNSWYNSLGDLQLDKIVKDSGRVGHGLMFVVPRNEYGEFTVDFKHISWRYFFPDPYSKDPLYSDMENSVYAMPMTVSTAYKIAKGVDTSLTMKIFKEEFVKGSHIEDMSFEEDNTYFHGSHVGKNSSNVLFIRRAALEETKVYIVVPLSQKVNLEGNGSNISFRVYPEIDDNLAELARQKKIKIIPKIRFQLTEYLSIGNYGRKKVLAITEHDIVAFTHNHRDTPFPYGRMWNLYPLQRAMNKFIASAILNQSLLNNVRILSEKGSIVNMKKWVRSASMPGVNLEYKLVNPVYSKPPEIVKANPMSGEWLVFPRYLTYMAEYISGVFGTMMGNPNDSPNVFSTVASLQSAGGQKFKRRMGYLDAALSRAGKIAASYYRDYSPPNGFNVAIDPITGKEKVETFNTLDLVSTETGKKRLVIKEDEDLSQGFRDVRFTTRASAGYEAATEAAMLTQLATQTKSAGLIPMILERLNIPGTDEYLKEQSETNQLKSQVQQDQTVIKQLETRTKTMQNQIVQAMYRIEQAKFKGNLDVELERFKKNPVEYLESSMNNQGTN